MSTYARTLLFIIGMLVLGIAPALAEGQATGKRTHKPLRLRTYYDQNINLDGQDFTIGSLMEEEGIFFVLLPQDPRVWDWEMLQELRVGPGAETFEKIAFLAVYPDSKYVKYVQEELDHLAEFMPVSLIDSTTRAWLPEVGDEVLVAFFAAPEAQYRGVFRSRGGLEAERRASGF